MSKQPAPPSFQGKSKQPDPSFQGTSKQPAPTFHGTSKQPAHSFQVTSQASFFVNSRAPRAPYKKHFRHSQENIKKLRVKTRDVLNLPRGDLIVLDFDYKDRPIGEAQGLLAGLYGLLATDCSIFTISYKKWPDIPKAYFDDCFDNIIKPRFHFLTTEPIARRYVNHSLCKKWVASRQNLWTEFYDPLKTKRQIMNNVPEGIARDQWISFINYRFKEATQKMCLRNAENRKKQNCPHTGGSKPNSRRMAEMMAESGTMPGRGQLYITTHTKQNGAYVNEEAREICEQIELALSKSTVDESEISPNDAVGKVLEKEHPGRVRCMGLGAAPSNTFRQANLRPGGIRLSSSNDAGCSSGCQVKYDKLLDTLKAYMIMKEGIIPEQFAEIFGSTPLMPSDSSSEQVSPMDVGGSSGDENH